MGKQSQFQMLASLIGTSQELLGRIVAIIGADGYHQMTFIPLALRGLIN